MKKLAIEEHFCAFLARGELKPIPEIHWRVDRNLAEYERRFGFDLVSMLTALREENKKKTLVELEFGPGSGISRAERTARGANERYLDIGIADTLYYPLNSLIGEMIDWPALEKTIKQRLTIEDKNLLTDMLYKTIMIADNEIEKDQFAYALERIGRITRDPNALRGIMQEIAPQLKNLTIMPDTVSTRDANGTVVYPYKINLEAKNKTKTLSAVDQKNAAGRSIAFVSAKAALSSDIDSYIKKDQPGKDVYDSIPSYPTGMMIGDFSQIKKLASNQIDVAIGVRSTVYKKEGEYVDFVYTLADKLSDGGVFIDDSVRDNDGYYYRLAELLSVKETLRQERNGGVVDFDINMKLILGPGFPGEDYRQDEVPLAVVMSKNTNHDAMLQLLLKQRPEYRLVDLKEYIQDKENLRTLDKTGQVLKTVSEVSEEFGF